MASEQSYWQRAKGVYGGAAERVGTTASAFAASGPGRAFKRGMGRALGFEYQHGKSMGFMGRGMKGSYFGAGKLAFGLRALGPAFLGMGIYRGYQEGGILGAAKEGALEMALWGAVEAGASVLTNPVVLAAAGITAAGVGYYKLGEASRKHRKRLRNVEMGSDLVDRFGTLTTMRQRSLAAIQRTHVSGRLALGNEALLLSQHMR
jgi:hypothetical protein